MRPTNYKNMVVACYTFQGQLVEVFKTAKEAAIATHCHPRTIDKCLRGEDKTIHHYLWRRFDKDHVPNSIEPYVKEPVSHIAKPVALVDEDGKILKIYHSIKQAALDNDTDPHSIRAVLQGKTKHAHGKIFIYHKEL